MLVYFQFAKTLELNVNTDITPFTIDIPDSQLEDLRDRLARTRWPEAETTDSWDQGMPLAYTRELAQYWARRCPAPKVVYRNLGLTSFFHLFIRLLGGALFQQAL